MTVSRASILATVSLMGVATPVFGQTSGAPSPTGDIAARRLACTQLGPHSTTPLETSRKFAMIEDAPTTIVSADTVPAGGAGKITDRDMPEICRVEGQITPTVGFLLRMPIGGWNGKLLMGGCGGPCGMLLNDRIDPALVRGYAVVATDMGHKGAGWIFAKNDLQQMVDFGFRATHVTALAAKAIVAEYYGDKPKRSYFSGCSTGGRQALVSAQRFAQDFDGIIGGAPPWMQTGHQPYVGVWGAKANIRADGTAILKASRLPFIHQAVMKACDAQDGLADGVLQNPLQCGWKPATLQCKAGQSGESCLSAEEVGVVDKIYAGPETSTGERLYHGMPRGSELVWAPLNIGPDGPGVYWQTTDTTLNSLAFLPAPPTDWDQRTFDFDKDPARLAANDVFFYHQNPDLSAFKARGGKLILYHGWNDNNLIPPELAIDYYEKATRTMGGANTTRDFFRLFMMPAMQHCRLGEGGGEVDWLTALENWVEKGQAPDSVVAYKMKAEPYPRADIGPFEKNDSQTYMPRHPLAPDSYEFARKVYAYPAITRFSGKGDPKDPANWVIARQ